MNYLKIQQDLVKQLINKPTSQTFIRVAKYHINYEDNIVVITNHTAFIIPENRFWLDYDKVAKELGEFSKSSIDSFFSKDMEYAYKTPRSITVDNEYGSKKSKPMTCSIFSIKEKNIDVAINNKLLTYFNGENNYKGIDNKSSIYIYEGETLVGFVLPVRWREEWGNNE